jgi:hypothetical protein
MANMTIAIRERVARAIVNAIELPNAGRLCDGGAEINVPLVGVACRVIVRVSVLPCAGLRVVGLKLQASQVGSAAFLSASRQEKVIGAVKPFTVIVTFAVELDAVRLTALGEIVPVGDVDVAKSISATAAPLAWLTQTISGVELASTPS